jgi:uncharacterized protein (DUF1800 family)
VAHCTGRAPNRPQAAACSAPCALLALLLLPSLLGACAGSSARAPSSYTPDTGSHPEIAPLRRQDALWLERVSFGLDEALVRDYERLGRERFLASQLDPQDRALPAPIAARIARLEAARPDPWQAIGEVRAERKSIRDLTDDATREDARKKLNERGNQLAYVAVRLELLRAVYSPAQLEEQMVWFWLNHFSVHQNKAEVRWLLADYEERAIRPHVLGHFRDLVLATLEHPAMLEYLDNAQNAAGHVNENYARELMELHTLGVHAGYTQQDVQALARVLTGVGIAGPNPPRLRPELKALYRREGAFEFNPARHDAGPKILLGHPIRGRGFAEVEDAVDLIVHQSACARFISTELAAYFVADEPPPALVERMAQTFQRTDGDLRAVLRTMFLAPELDGLLGGKFKDPMRFVVSAVRLAYDGRPISNARPLLQWLNGLGEAPFGRATPDGYPLVESAWSSSGQMSRRFEIARLIGSGSAGLFNSEDGESATAAAGFPQLSNRLYFAAVEPFLARSTRATLDAATSPQEWNTFLLASPEFNYE